MSQTSQAFRTAMHVPLTDPNSGNVINIVVPGNDYVSGWSSASGLPEAPSDSVTYGRKNLAWVAIPDDPQELLDKILTVDGQGSGLDADTIDGMNSTVFAQKTEVDALFMSIDCGTF